MLQVHSESERHGIGANVIGRDAGEVEVLGNWSCPSAWLFGRAASTVLKCQQALFSRNHDRGKQNMIARHWRGWTKTHNADDYENLLKTHVLPGLKSISGYRGGYVLRSDGVEEVEFVVVNLFDSLDAVKQFAGPEYSVAVFEPEARRLLSKVEPTAMHYEVRVNTV